MFSKKLFIGKSKIKDIILSKVNELLISAKAHYEEKEFSSAIIKLEALLSIEENNLDGLWLMGISYMASYKYLKALEYLNHLYEIQKDVNTSLNISICYLHLNDRENEYSYLKKAEEINSKNIKTIRLLAEYYWRVKQIGESALYYEKGLNLESDSMDLLLSYQRFRYIYYDDIEYSKTFFENYLKSHLKEFEFIRAYINYLSLENNFIEADKYYKIAIKLKDDYIIKSSYCEFLIRTRLDKEEGNLVINKLIKYHSNNPRVLYHYLRIVGYYRKDKEEVLRLKDFILKNFNEEVELLTTLSGVLLEYNEFLSESFDLSNKAVQLDPYDDSSLSQMAYVFLRMNEPTKSENAYEKAYTMDPYSFISSMNFSGILFINGKYEKATEILERAFPFTKRKEKYLIDFYFLSYLHINDIERVLDAERNLLMLIERGVKSTSDYTFNIQKASEGFGRKRENFSRYESLLKED